jgi:hypothetical protein
MNVLQPPLTNSTLQDGRGKELVQKDSRRYWKRTTNKHRGKFDQKTKTWLPKPASKLSILSTCKQVHQEAVAVLYGKQTFEFIHMRELRDCLPLLGNNIKYLRFISVSTYGYVADRKSAREVLKTLVAAKGLRKIYLSHFELCKETVENAHGHHEVAHKSPALTAEELVKNAEPLLRSLHVSYKGHNLSVMDLLEIELRGPCVHQWYSHPRPGHRFGPAGYPRSCKSLCICGTESQCNEKKQAEVRDEIAKLGLDST